MRNLFIITLHVILQSCIYYVYIYLQYTTISHVVKSDYILTNTSLQLFYHYQYINPPNWQQCGSDTCPIQDLQIIFVQPQCKRMTHALIESTRVVQNATHILLCSSHTHHVYQRQIIHLVVVECFQIKQTCDTYLFWWSKSEARVCGIFSDEQQL